MTSPCIHGHAWPRCPRCVPKLRASKADWFAAIRVMLAARKENDDGK